MIRICTSLAEGGYDVTLVGTRRRTATPLQKEPFKQVRLRTWFRKGFGFYAEYNIRLFSISFFVKWIWFAQSTWIPFSPAILFRACGGKKRVYDAHELFCEMQEIVERPRIYRIWKKIERFTVPHFKTGYTVNTPIAEEFEKMYGVKYGVVRNVPFFKGTGNSGKTGTIYFIPGCSK
ncbi:MAG: glycosyltransferase family 4 protein [Chitinophagaceae bacterium]|nr:glycosyltransferase family 4 protein [Chitinophagaceae bacterium]